SAVACAVQAAEPGVFDEALGGERGFVQVAAGEARAADAELALDHLRGAPRHWTANRDRLAGAHAAAHAGDRAFGGAVAVLHPASARPAIGEVLRQGLAADVEQLEVGQLEFGMVASGSAQQRWWRAEDAGALPTQPGDEVGT